MAVSIPDVFFRCSLYGPVSRRCAFVITKLAKWSPSCGGLGSRSHPRPRVPGPGGGRPGEAAVGDVDAEVLAALDGDVAQAAHVDVGFVGLLFNLLKNGGRFDWDRVFECDENGHL